MPVAYPPSPHALLDAFLEPSAPTLPALARTLGLSISALIHRLLDPAVGALLDAAESLQSRRARLLGSPHTNAAIASLAQLLRAPTNPVEARRAATTLLSATRSSPRRAALARQSSTTDAPAALPSCPLEESSNGIPHPRFLSPGYGISATMPHVDRLSPGAPGRPKPAQPESVPRADAPTTGSAAQATPPVPLPVRASPTASLLSAAGSTRARPRTPRFDSS